MISLAEALRRLLDDVAALTDVEDVPTGSAVGRTLAEAVVAGRDQPPFRASAMDGYAVIAADTESDKPLVLVGESRAGRGFAGELASGQTVRTFTGAPVPEGADAILIQENAAVATDGSIVARKTVATGKFVRPRGFDFTAGTTLLRAGTLLDAGGASLAASAGVPALRVRRRPRVVIIATGDEIVPPGRTPGPDAIFASSGVGVAAILAEAGAETVDLGVARDTEAELDRAFDRAANADIVVTLGGASVGDHDLVRPVLARRGVALAFEKVAMRPGKPLMHGRDERRYYLGLPGNPVSSLVCARLFGQPLVAALLGREHRHAWTRGRLGRDLGANDEREEFMRATVRVGADGVPVATPFDRQDSSLVSRYALADALVHRAVHAAAAGAGDTCWLLPLRPFAGMAGPLLSERGTPA